MTSLPVCMPGPMFLLGVSVPGPMLLPGASAQGFSAQGASAQGCLCPGESLSRGGGVCRETTRNQKTG